MNRNPRFVTRTILMAFFLSGVLALAGCGGGGGGGGAAAAVTPTPTPTSTIVSGTAAAGAAVIGTVSVRDSSSNPQPVKTGIPIAADGKYSVDVNGLKPPFAFLADGTVGGKRVQLYSAATQADVGGTIDITPFTDLVVRNIAGTIATTLADAISSQLPNLTTAQLNAKVVDLTAKLTPVLQAAGLATDIDLLRATFNADGTGLDRIMDLVKVDTTVPTAVTITNILDAANPLTINSATGATTTGGATLSATGVTKTATPVDGIAQTFSTFGTFFATSLPSVTDPALVALFSSTFIDGGKSSGAFLTEVATSKDTIGMKLTNGIVVDSVDTVAGTARVHFFPLSAAGANLAHDQPGGAMNWQMKLVNGSWLFDGDQRIARVRVRTFAQAMICNAGSSNCTAGTAYSTGLNLDIDNKGQIGIGSAVVTGPGLPSGGATLTAQPNQTWLSLPTPCTGCSNNYYAMSDATIKTITANSTYTVALYSNASTPQLLATYTEVVPVAPVLNTALSTLAFPSISGMVSLTGYTSGTLTPSWTIPAGLFGDGVSVDVFQPGTSAGAAGPNLFVMADLSNQTAASATATLVVTAPATGSWQSGNYAIYAWDQYGGQVTAHYQ